MYVSISIIPPNKNYIVIKHLDGRTEKFPRHLAKHVSVGDVCTIEQFHNRPQLKLLTDYDEAVIVDAAKNKPETPEPIRTPTCEL
jgi:hypothetical protein